MNTLRIKELEQQRDTLTAQVETLRAALKKADDAIMRGQAARSESEFMRWSHDAQAARPSADLIRRPSQEP